MTLLQGRLQLISGLVLCLFVVFTAGVAIRPFSSEGYWRLEGNKVRRDSEATGRIAGGNTAFYGEFPWQVSIQVTNFQMGIHICGGALINTEWVLTAAHCLDSEKPEWLWVGSTDKQIIYSVVTGDFQLHVEDGHEQRLLVDYFVKHPEYTYWKTPYENDIALIHLATPATINAFTAVAPLPSSPDLLPPVFCHIAGWGAAAEGVSGPDTLQWVDVPLLTKDKCQRAYGEDIPNTLCGGYPQGGKGACLGDNGGPLMCQQGTRNTVVALMSWREGCALPNKPGIYVDVWKYLPWIRSNTM